MTDAVAEFRGEKPLNLLPAEVLDPGQDAANEHVGSRLGKQRRPQADAVARVAFAQMHLPHPAVLARRRQQQILAQRPETEEANAELTLQSSCSRRLQASLD